VLAGLNRGGGEATNPGPSRPNPATPGPDLRCAAAGATRAVATPPTHTVGFETSGDGGADLDIDDIWRKARRDSGGSARQQHFCAAAVALHAGGGPACWLGPPASGGRPRVRWGPCFASRAP
jgi:hypothetical protein